MDLLISADENCRSARSGQIAEPGRAGRERLRNHNTVRNSPCLLTSGKHRGAHFIRTPTELFAQCRS